MSPNDGFCPFTFVVPTPMFVHVFSFNTFGFNSRIDPLTKNKKRAGAEHQDWQQSSSLNLATGLVETAASHSFI